MSFRLAIGPSTRALAQRLPEMKSEIIINGHGGALFHWNNSLQMILNGFRIVTARCETEKRKKINEQLDYYYYDDAFCLFIYLFGFMVSGYEVLELDL